MKCSRVERILPLSVGEELEGRQKREVEEHLAACEGCRSLQRDLLRSRGWIASIPAPSLGEAESAERRRGIWREIESRGLRAGEAPPRYRRLALSGAVGLLVAILAGDSPCSRGGVQGEPLRRPRPQSRPRPKGRGCRAAANRRR